jgi:hypothetical protein
MSAPGSRTEVPHRRAEVAFLTHSGYGQPAARYRGPALASGGNAANTDRVRCRILRLSREEIDRIMEDESKPWPSKRSASGSFDDAISTHSNLRWNSNTKIISRLGIDDQKSLLRSFDRQIGRVCAFEYLRDVVGHALKVVIEIAP